MLKRFILIPIFVILLPVSAALASQESLPGILKGIQAKHCDLPGLKIEYTREVVTRSMSMLGNQLQGQP